MVFVLGGAQTDFARNFTREGKRMLDLVEESVAATLSACAVDAPDVEVIHVGNFAAELYTGQGHLGAMVGEAIPALAGTPASRHEAACASGSMAVLAAMADLEAGRYDLALVLGVEFMRNVSGQECARLLGAAALVPDETRDVKWVWPSVFARVGDEYEARYGLDRAHLVALARSHFANAQRNPLAQTRSWTLSDAHFADDDSPGTRNPRVEGRLRKQDCSQITDGGAAVLLASPRFAEAWARGRGVPLDRVARIAGWGHRTARLAFAPKLDQRAQAAGGQKYIFPEVRRAITDCYRRAGLDEQSGPRALDAIECHDCFTTTAYMAIDHIGLTAPGESWRAIEDGRVLSGGRVPLNPSGGLMGLGHPVGASGVRMLLDAQRQVTGGAGACQVEGARRVLTLNIGGSTTTTASFLVERD